MPALVALPSTAPGIFPGMRTTIDRAGRVVVPKSLRAALGLEGGDEVEITLEGERIELVPAPRRVNLQKGPGGLLVSDVGVGVGPNEVREELERTRP
ncbi:MAG TPA: AbrB/MazE/SpoVT family DNA-binding domain-containing protein [Solirubrobacterales bacterium]|nr:AbrB/MazE/SpoVT family DNA-binding domain-containing protein [Solirubrobacterales bacterium]